ncbi:CocE/NonD family hydrolase [Streptomyces sp. NPDC005244]|uniref:CocE/NonD family hydrolase n=1 Tax=Streptomyces sp. NPDC005244 TaxID=3364708 RepID=UPI0036CB6D68
MGTPSPSGCAQNVPVRSYAGWTQWALLMDPPPELRTSLIAVAPHNLYEAVYGGGAFHVGDFLHWAAMLINQERFTGLWAVARALTMKRRLAPGLRRPLVGRHDDRAPRAVAQGMADDSRLQQLDMGSAQARRGSSAGDRPGAAHRRLEWLETHLADEAPGQPRSAPRVEVYVTGQGAWRQLAEWPPAAGETVHYLQPGGRLLADEASGGGAPSTYVYDPANPTRPSVAPCSPLTAEAGTTRKWRAAPMGSPSPPTR